MDRWIELSIIWALLLTSSVISAALLWILQRWLRNRHLLSEQRILLEKEKLTVESQSGHELVALLDKAIGLLSTKDPLAFQQVQVMSDPSAYDDVDYDPSDEAEIQRINARSDGLTDLESLDAEERAFLDSLGVDPFFVRPD